MSVKLAPPWRVSVFSRPFEFELSFLSLISSSFLVVALSLAEYCAPIRHNVIMMKQYKSALTSYIGFKSHLVLFKDTVTVSHQKVSL